MARCLPVVAAGLLSGCAAFYSTPTQQGLTLLQLTSMVQCELKRALSQLQSGDFQRNYSAVMAMTITAKDVGSVSLSPFTVTVPASFSLTIGPTASRTGTLEQIIKTPPLVFRLSDLTNWNCPAAMPAVNLVTLYNGELFGPLLQFAELAADWTRPEGAPLGTHATSSQDKGVFTYSTEFTVENKMGLNANGNPTNLSAGLALSRTDSDIHKLVVSFIFDPVAAGSAGVSSSARRTLTDNLDRLELLSALETGNSGPAL